MDSSRARSRREVSRPSTGSLGLLLIEIFVDGDGCPVKEETYVVATRYEVPVSLVANSRMSVPRDLGVEMILVEQGPDAADDWIAENVRSGDVVVTADIPLAARCLDGGAAVLGSDGRPFREDSIGNALASRQLHADLREAGQVVRGPPALSQKQRSRFLSRLDELVQRSDRQAGRSLYLQLRVHLLSVVHARHDCQVPELRG